MPQIQRMMEEHRCHGRVLDRLWALTSAPEQALTSARWRKLLALEIQEFVATLAEHFASEERDGYMRQVVELRPDLAAQAAMLREQHITIRAGFETIVKRLRAGLDIPGSQAQLREVLAITRAHEDGENELVQEALHRDIGGLG